MRTLTLALVLGTSLLACGDKDDDTGSNEADADTDADTDSDTDSDTDADADKVNFTGTVTFDDGGISPDELVTQMCDALACVQGPVDASGVFSFDLNPGSFAFEVLYRGQQDSYATALAPLTLEEATDKALTETLRVYEYATYELLTKTVVVEGDNIRFPAADPSTMTPAITSPSQETFVATVQVDPSTAGLPIEDINGTVVAQWYMGNFDVALDPAWAFEVDDAMGLADGTQLQIYTAHYAGAEWSHDGTATVTNGVILSDPGSGIHYLSTMLLVQE